MTAALSDRSLFMKSNIGISDRAFRLFIGLSLIGLGVALESAWGLLGLIPRIRPTITIYRPSRGGLAFQHGFNPCATLSMRTA